MSKVAKTVVRGWVVQWQNDADGQWYPDNTQAGQDISLVWFRRTEALAVLPTRKAAREELARCRRAWTEFASSVPPFRIRRATVTLEVS